MSSYADKLAELKNAYGAKRAYLIARHEAEQRKLRASFVGKDGLLNFIRHFWHDRCAAFT